MNIFSTKSINWKGPLLWLLIGFSIAVVLWLITCSKSTTVPVKDPATVGTEVRIVTDSFQQKFMREDSINKILLAKDTVNRGNLHKLVGTVRSLQYRLKEYSLKDTIHKDPDEDLIAMIDDLILTSNLKDSVCDATIANLDIQLVLKDSVIAQKDSLNQFMQTTLDSVLNDESKLIKANKREKHNATLGKILWKSVAAILAALYIYKTIR